MKFKSFLAIAASALVALAVVSCKDSGNEEITKPECSFSEGTLAFEAAGGTLTVELLATRDWTLSCEDSFVGIDPTKGEGSSQKVKIEISVTDNTEGYDREATISANAGNGLAKASLKIKQAGGKGDENEVLKITCAEFIAKADTEHPYVLEGKVSNVNASYKYFYITDETGTVQVYQPDNFAEYEIETGGTAKVKGVYKLYTNANTGATTHEMEQGTILSYTAPDLGEHIFATTFTSSLGAFTEEVKSGTLSSVWSYDATYKCAKATAYVSGKNNASESWLVSPEIDLTSETAATLTFDHAANYFISVATEVSLWVSKNGGEYVELVIPTYPTSTGSFTFVSSGKISLKDFVGSKVKIALVYTSTATKAGTYEVQNFFVDAEDSGETIYPTVERCGTVGEILALAKDTKFSLVTEALVVAKTTSGVVISDETGTVYVYDAEATPNIAIGDKITFTGSTYVYNGVPEIVSISDVTVASSGNAVSYPTATDITGSFDSYSATAAEYISIVGTLSLSKSSDDKTTYYNLEVPGASNQGSISLPLESFGLDALEGKLLKVTGYYNGFSSSNKYHNVIAVSVEESDMPLLTVSTTALTVAAADETATFTVGGTASWKVTCDDTNLSASPASGSGEATVTLSFPANTDTENAKTYNVKVSTEQDAPVKEFIVVVTQKKASSGDELVDVLDRDFTGVTGTNYAEWSEKKGTNSPAVYAGQSAGGNESIQLRSNNNNSGIVTTTSGGKVKKVVVTWNSNTASGRTLNIYGSDSAYTSPTQLYSDSTSGKLLGTIVCGTSTELEIDEDIAYIGLRSKASAMYITSIEITWE